MTQQKAASYSPISVKTKDSEALEDRQVRLYEYEK